MLSKLQTKPQSSDPRLTIRPLEVTGHGTDPIMTIRGAQKSTKKISYRIGTVGAGSCLYTHIYRHCVSEKKFPTLNYL